MWEGEVGEESDSSEQPAAPAQGAPRLLAQVREAIGRRYYSRRTEQAYIHWIKCFIYFHAGGIRARWARPR